MTTPPPPHGPETPPADPGTGGGPSGASTPSQEAAVELQSPEGVVDPPDAATAPPGSEEAPQPPLPLPEPQRAPQPCTCAAFRDRPDLDEINAALLVEPLTRIAARIGINKGTVWKHRQRCCGIGPGPKDPPSATPARPTPQPPRQPRPQRPATPATHKETARNAPLVKTAPPPPPPRPISARATPPQLTPEEKKTADQIRIIADVVAMGEWRGWVTAQALASKLQIPEEEVLRLHQLAAGKVGEARGTQRAQRESSVAATRRMRDEERDAAARYDKEAVDAYTKAKTEKDPKARGALYVQARNSRKLAASHRRSAIDCQKHLDAITILKPPAVVVNVNYRGNPDFGIAFRAMGEAADALWGPGSSARLEQALAALEDDGPQGFEAWIAEHRVITVESTPEPPPSPPGPAPPAPAQEPEAAE